MLITDITKYKIIGPVPKSTVKNTNDDVIDIAFENFILPSDNLVSQLNLVEMAPERLRMTMENLKDLQNLRTSIKLFGMTKSLLSFANHDHSLTALIPEIPSLETLKTDLSPKQSQDIIVALEAKIGALISYIWTTLKSDFKAFFQKNKYHLVGLDSIVRAVDDMNHLLSEGRQFDKDYAEQKKVKLPKFNDLINIIKHIHDYVEMVSEYVKQSLPLTHSEYHDWINKLDKSMMKYKSICRYTLNPSGHMGLHNSDSELKHVYEKTSLTELGYSGLEQFKTIYTEFKNTVQILDMVMSKDITSTLPRPDDQKDASKSVINDAVAVIYDLYHNIQHMQSWLEVHVPQSLRAIYFCTDSAKKAVEDFSVESPQLNIDEMISLEDLRLKENLNTIKQLNLLSQSIRKYGLTRSLLCFADHNKILAANIPELPFWNDFVADRSPKNSINVAIAVEGLFDSLKESISRLLEQTEKQKIKIAKIEKNIYDLEKEIKNKIIYFDVELAKNKKVFLISLSDLRKACNLIMESDNILKSILSSKLPTDKSEFDIWIKSINSKLSIVGDAFGVCIENDTIKRKDSHFIDKKYEESSLYSLGYTKDDDIYQLGSINIDSVCESVLQDEDITDRAYNLPHDSQNVFTKRAVYIISEFSIFPEKNLEWIDEMIDKTVHEIYSCTKKVEN